MCDPQEIAEVVFILRSVEKNGKRTSCLPDFLSNKMPVELPLKHGTFFFNILVHLFERDNFSVDDMTLSGVTSPGILQVVEEEPLALALPQHMRIMNNNQGRLRFGLG